jgi:malate dehydrogenase
MKISVIGAGQVGGHLAYLLTNLDNIFVSLYDIDPDIALGKSLDIMQSHMLTNRLPNLSAPKTLEEALDNTDIVVVAGGKARRPGMSRDDLLLENAKVIDSIARAIKKSAPDAIICVVTNPVDTMTLLMQYQTECPYHRVMGMAGVLDSARMRYFMSLETKTHPKDIVCQVLGGHGDTMVPVLSQTTIQGHPCTDFLNSDQSLNKLVERTRNGGGEIVNLLKTSATYFAPAQSVMVMLKAIIYDQKKILPVSCYLDNENIYMGVCATLGKAGIEKIHEPVLDENEKNWWYSSLKSVKNLSQTLRKNNFLNDNQLD